MNKNTKTALIVALSIFGAGVLIWLCVSMSVGFNYSKLSVANIGSSESSDVDDTKFKSEHFDKLIAENGQSVALNLSSADVTVSLSDDGEIHLSYDSTEQTYFEYKESEGAISLTQKQKVGSLSQLIIIGSYEKTIISLSLPADRSGTLKINGASSEIYVSDVVMKHDMDIYGVSGDMTIKNCSSAGLNTGSVSGIITIDSVSTASIEAGSVSGDIRLTAINAAIPVMLQSTSGQVYAEKVKTTKLDIGLVSGGVTLKNVSGEKADISSTSGGVTLDAADFFALDFSTVSGDISGSVKGKSDDYTVYTDTISGHNALSSHRGRGERTLDLSSTSGSFNIRFAG